MKRTISIILLILSFGILLAAEKDSVATRKYYRLEEIRS